MSRPVRPTERLNDENSASMNQASTSTLTKTCDPAQDKDSTLSDSNQFKKRPRDQDLISAYDIGSPVPSYVYSCSISEYSNYSTHWVQIRNSPEPEASDPKLKRIQFDYFSDPELGDLFYDSLSKIHLTAAALKELDRRNRLTHLWVQREKLWSLFITPPARQVRTQDRSILPIEDFHYPSESLSLCAKNGGFDLSDLRGFKRDIHPIDDIIMAAMKAERVPKLPWDKENYKELSLEHTESEKPRDNNFRQNLEDHGIHARDSICFEKFFPRPANNPQLISIISTARDELVLGRKLTEDFATLSRKCQRATNEADVEAYFYRIEDETNDSNTKARGLGCANKIMNNYLPLTNGKLAPGNPDRLWIVLGSRLRIELRDDNYLKYLIIGFKTNTGYGMLANFIIHLKGPQGNDDHAISQALYDGALAARAMHALRLYAFGNSAWDGKAYAIATIFKKRTLTMYTIHLARNAGNGKTEYFMNSIGTAVIDQSEKDYIRGLTMYRNLCDWAARQRNELVEAANAKFSDTRSTKSPELEAFYNQCKSQIKHSCYGTIVKSNNTQGTN